MKLPDKVYEVLKWLVLIALPALSTFYTVVAPLFNWYDPGIVAKVIAAICTLVGTLIGISTAAYRKEAVYDEEADIVEEEKDW